MNLFRRLGIDPSDPDLEDPVKTDEMIRRAYQGAAREHHPDRNIGDADSPRRFMRIQEAYDRLSEPHARHFYRATDRYEADRRRREAAARTMSTRVSSALYELLDTEILRRRMALLFDERPIDEAALMRDSLLTLVDRLTSGNEFFPYAVQTRLRQQPGGLNQADSESFTGRHWQEVFRAFLNEHWALFGAATPSTEQVGQMDRFLARIRDTFDGPWLSGARLAMWRAVIEHAPDAAAANALLEHYTRTIFANPHATETDRQRLTQMFEALSESAPVPGERSPRVAFLRRLVDQAMTAEQANRETMRRGQVLRPVLKGIHDHFINSVGAEEYAREMESVLALLDARLPRAASEPIALLRSGEARDDATARRLWGERLANDYLRDELIDHVQELVKEHGEQYARMVLRLPALRGAIRDRMAGTDWRSDRDRCTELVAIYSRALTPIRALPPPPE